MNVSKAQAHTIAKKIRKIKTIKCKLTQHIDFYIKKSKHQPEQQNQQKHDKHHRNKLLLLNECISNPVAHKETKYDGENCYKQIVQE